MDPERFLSAQQRHYADALAELRRGRKATHWIWFVFPQLGALGRSGAAKFYGLEGLDDARAWLDHPILGPRLVAAVKAATAAPAIDAVSLFGETDALKFRSCLTLFVEAAEDGAPFAAALERFYGGERDPSTLASLGLAP
jgi:uncharacterized protein (DUF1810 family)